MSATPAVLEEYIDILSDLHAVVGDLLVLRMHAFLSAELACGS